MNLAPCGHWGNTPPCAEALIQAGVARVVIAMADPNPLAESGLAQLHEAGIAVTLGVCEPAARILNQGFVSRFTRRRPWVRAKIAGSLDGRTALSNGQSKWITGPEAREFGHYLRARSGAILTGINTILMDDPALSARVDKKVHDPMKVVLDTHGRLPKVAQIFQSPGRVCVATCSDSDFDPNNALVWRVSANAAGRVDLTAVLALLADHGVNELLVEAGPTLLGQFIAEDLVDELWYFMAPICLGEQARPLMHLPELRTLSNAKRYAAPRYTILGEDLCLVFERKECLQES